MKLEAQHKNINKNIMRFISRNCGEDGWATVNEHLFPILSKTIPQELAQFEQHETGPRARLTAEGQNVLDAMKLL